MTPDLATILDGDHPGVDPELDAVVRTIYGEAGGEPDEGKAAVAAVIRNRAKAANKPLSAIVHEPGQFEAWSDPKSANAMMGLDPASPEYQAISKLVTTTLASDSDPTGGADAFFSPSLQAARGRPAPAWATGEGQTIGGHSFFKTGYGQQAPPSSGPNLAEILDANPDPGSQPAAGVESKGLADIPGAALSPVFYRADDVLGALKGGLKPFDNAAMGLEYLAGRAGVPTDAINKLTGSPSAVQVADRHNKFFADASAGDVRPGALGEWAGNVAATLPLMALTKNPYALGALFGAANTDSRSPTGVAQDAVVGAVGGKLTDLGVSGVGAAISPKFSPHVNLLTGEGVRLTPGQMAGGFAKAAEDKLTSAPIVGDAISAARTRGLNDFNRAALNRALRPVGAELPANVGIGYEGVSHAQDVLSRAYDDVLAGVTITPDAQLKTDLVTNLKPLVDAMTKDRADQLQSIIASRVFDRFKDGAITGEAMKDVDSQLGTLERRYMKSPDGDQQTFAEGIAEVRGALRDLVARNNPAVGARLRDINTGYAALTRVERAAASSGAESGVFSPAQLQAAVRAEDSTVRHRGFAAGNALMQDLSAAAKTTLPSKYPDSGTGGRMLFNGLAGGLLLDNLPHINPLLAAGVGAATVPYLPLGETVANKLLTARPSWAPAARQALTRFKAPLVAGGGAAAVRAYGSGAQ